MKSEENYDNNCKHYSPNLLKLKNVHRWNIKQLSFWGFKELHPYNEPMKYV